MAYKPCQTGNSGKKHKFAFHRIKPIGVDSLNVNPTDEF